MTLSRRAFLRHVVAVPIAAAAAPLLPAAKATSVGIATKFIQQYRADGKTVCRLDVLYGFSVARPDFAVRIAE